MPDHLPDILQSAGLTPHEVGWLQLHAEPVLRSDDGTAVAELWLQAAFHPSGGGRVELVDAATGASLAGAPLPQVPKGGAIRWRIPLRLDASVASVRWNVHATTPEDATRIRSPWKLLDTIEIRLPEEDAGGALEVAARLTGVAGAAVIAATTRPAAQRPSGMKVHPARAVARALISDVIPASEGESFDAAIETLWIPGDPVDGDVLKARLRQHRSSGPSCPSCGAELVPGGEFCPRCLGPVAAVAARTAAPQGNPLGLPPLAEMANSDLRPPDPEEDEAPVFCTRHPNNRATGTCGRCANFFCDEFECASSESAGLCASCEKKFRARPEGPSQLTASQLFRDGAFWHLGIFFVLALRPFVGIVLEYRHVFTVADALPFSGVGLLLYGVRKPLSLLVALGVDLLAIADAFSTDDWSRLALGLIPLAVTTVLWLRLPDPDELPQAQA